MLLESLVDEAGGLTDSEILLLRAILLPRSDLPLKKRHHTRPPHSILNLPDEFNLELRFLDRTLRDPAPDHPAQRLRPQFIELGGLLVGHHRLVKVPHHELLVGEFDGVRTFKGLTLTRTLDELDGQVKDRVVAAGEPGEEAC